MVNQSKRSIASLLGIGVVSAGILMVGLSQPVQAGKVCFGKLVTNSSHSAQKARAALVGKVFSEINAAQARGMSARQNGRTQCSSNSGRTTCTAVVLMCPQ